MSLDINFKKGFTILEAVVSVAVFVFLSAIVLQIYSLVIDEIRLYRDQIAVVSLANQYIEIARNLSYADIGTIHGDTCDKPEGELCILPDLASPDSVDVGGVAYNVYFSISYADDPADGTILLGTDFDPNDYKKVKLYVANTGTGVIKDFLTVISPKGLESLGNRGVLLIEVFNAIGQPVEEAEIHIVNENFNPVFDVTRISGSDGNWVEVGLNPDVNGYRVTVTKDGYSTDRTYPITIENPNPTKPDSTILVGEVTQVSFSIDHLSSLTFYTKNQTCQIIQGADFQIRGAKLIGTSPSVYKFDENYTSDSGGIIYPVSDLCTEGRCLEWDSYEVSAVSGDYMVYGTSPIQQTSILPGVEQEFSLLLGPRSDHSMLVTVKESGTGNSIEGASVDLQNPLLQHTIKFTGGSVWGQNDWSEYSELYNVSTVEIPYALRLAKSGQDYVSSGWLVSSTFDTGTEETVYTVLDWQPISQVSNTDIKFQVASNNDNETWNFIGPDGTVGTYYEDPGNTISAENNNARYIRYKVFLLTSNPDVTPVLTSVSLNYISGCNTPGQVMFSGLSYTDPENPTDRYGITVDKEGYETQIIEDLIVDGYGLLEVELSN